ncbi:hypothetical protein [Ornithinimicrobium faecis]|nr:MULTISPECIES: hypothetical protein [unclassified Ornithinimicrobium]
MCFPIDLDVARDIHAERSRTLEVENRLALSTEANGSRSTTRRR